MHYSLLAVDYDGTLALNGRVAPESLTALQRLRDSGRRSLLITGRQIGDLHKVFSKPSLFDCIVAENGGVLYMPKDDREVLLAEPPSSAFITGLASRMVEPLSIGRVVIATLIREQEKVQQAIAELGLPCQLIINREALMVLPPNVDKASGLRHAVKELGLSLQETVGVGDAENDAAFLRLCGCSIAVANAVPSLRQQTTLRTAADNGDGVRSVIDELVANDLSA